jgi:hypothetical protein
MTKTRHVTSNGRGLLHAFWSQCSLLGTRLPSFTAHPMFCMHGGLLPFAIVRQQTSFPTFLNF